MLGYVNREECSIQYDRYDMLVSLLHIQLFQSVKKIQNILVSFIERYVVSKSSLAVRS
jgi:hypothetical protein